MTTRQAISVIDSLRNGWYTGPTTYHMKKCEFIYQSHLRSGIKELEIYLLEHKDQNPISGVEDFRYLMDYYACETKNESANFMFSVYYDVATDVLDTLLNMK